MLATSVLLPRAPRAPRSCFGARPFCAAAAGRCAAGSPSLPELRRRSIAASAAAADADGPENRQLAPVVPVSPTGDFLSHMLSMEPHLFDEAVDAQLERLAAEAAAAGAAAAGGSEVTLYRRIEDVKRRARSQSVQDLMYYSVLRKFMSLGVDLLPPLDGAADVGSVNLVALTKGVHSVEALELVREHLENALGGGGGRAPPMQQQLVRMSKLQAAQVYAASLMFGYFLRRVDARFQLARQTGTLPRSQEETVKALEALFNSAAAEEPEAGAAAASAPGGPSPLDQPPAAALEPQRQASLRGYVRSFDAETLAATARIVSLEGVALVERQTTALFGSIDALSEEMTKVIGEGVTSREDFMQRMGKALESGEIKSITLTYAAQRRVVLEALAFGSFLRDVEGRVGAGEHSTLLTPTTGSSM